MYDYGQQMFLITDMIVMTAVILLASLAGANKDWVLRLTLIYHICFASICITALFETNANVKNEMKNYHTVTLISRSDFVA